ncbi:MULTISPECIES: hypothetical protein [unclassified Sphingomonas]|uniref:hypothetical protein n=1 Tax=unclassified Sphingomonas TaxID=196159 RepID=UPI00226A4BA3|nr:MULTISPECIES: hypothetical protein [unclassified Sphingomonas]
MHNSFYPADAVAFGRLRRDEPGNELDLSAYPKPRSLGPTPREFFAPYTPLAGKPVHKGLSRAVRRWRRAEAPEAPRPIERILSMVTDLPDRLANWLTAGAIGVGVIWIGVPVALAAFAGALH